VAEIFGRLDTDGSGTLDLSEVERLTAALGVVLSRTSAQEMFAQVRHQHQQTGLSVMCSVASVRLGSHCSGLLCWQMDTDGDGVVDLKKFESWWAAHYSDDGGFVTSDGEDDTE
jgi:hypothetical protein